MTQILVVKQKESPNAHYIGRGTALGNPFVMIDEVDRDEVVELYDQWFEAKCYDQSLPILYTLAQLYAKAVHAGGLELGCHCAPRRCHGDVVKAKLDAMLKQRYQITAFTTEGYEVSSKGDKRFSAFNAVMADNRTIEMHYQCDVKGYEPGGVNWKLGKGKPPKNKMTQDELYEGYLNLWRIWAQDKTQLLDELYALSTFFNYSLKDMFAKTPVNQAVALAQLINERSKNAFQ